MRRVLEVNVDDNGYGGVYAFVRSLIENKPENIKIDIACLEPFENPKNIAYLNTYGCDVHYIGQAGNKVLKQFAYYSKLKNLLKKQKYDCVHIHSDVANKMLVTALAAKKSGQKRIILHSHASGIDRENFGGRLKLHRGCRRFLPMVGTDFVACSDLAAEWMFPHMDRDKVQLIHNGIMLNSYRYDEKIRRLIRQELGIREELLIGHVGRFAYQKNHRYLLKVLKETLKISPNARLLLVGEGPLEKEIKGLADQMQLTSNIIFFGTSDRVNELLQAMDVFILPSHFEGLPIIGVEAQAAGLPTLFSDQITASAKLTEYADFLPITEKALPQWAERICAWGQREHEDNYGKLKQQGFDIQTTIEELLRLYQ